MAEVRPCSLHTRTYVSLVPDFSEALLSFTVLVLACAGLYTAMAASGEWAGNRLKAVLAGAVGCAVALSACSELTMAYLERVASDPISAEGHLETRWALGVLLVASAALGFARSTFYRFMPLDRAVATIDRFAASLQHGDGTGNPVALQNAIRSLERLPLDPAYKANLVQAPAIARVQAAFRR